MEIENIRELIEQFKRSDLTKLNLKVEGFELKLEREKEYVSHDQTVKVISQQESQHQTLEPVEQAPTGYHKIESPMVGTFYASSSPEEEHFVTVGSKVKKGDVVCIIEAMKLMNEVEADRDGEVVEILVANEAVVEYGQPLFVIK